MELAGPDKGISEDETEDASGEGLANELDWQEELDFALYIRTTLISMPQITSLMSHLSTFSDLLQA